MVQHIFVIIGNKYNHNSQVYTSSRVQASTNLVTGPAHQWEERGGFEVGSRRPPGLSEERNEHTSEQTAQIGQKGKQDN